MVQASRPLSLDQFPLAVKALAPVAMQIHNRTKQAGEAAGIAGGTSGAVSVEMESGQPTPA